MVVQDVVLRLKEKERQWVIFVTIFVTPVTGHNSGADGRSEAKGVANELQLAYETNQLQWKIALLTPVVL